MGQIIEEELHTHPRPASDHQLVASGLTAALGGPFGFGRGGPGGWWILPEPELRLRQDFLVPDLAGWGRERMPVMPRVPRFELAPDWVCEILSPSTARVDRVLKKHVYAREGVPFLWYVDPVARVLEVLALREGAWVEPGSWAEDAQVRAAPFEALELEFPPLWIPD